MRIGVLHFLFGTWKTKLFFCWALIAFLLWFFSKDLLTVFSALGALMAGISTIIFWHYKKKLEQKLKKLSLSTKQKFILIGSLAAAWVEIEFWIIERISGVSGIAASSSLFLDLLVTMPWYIIMTFFLWKVVTKYSYSIYEILIYGGIYDLFADGIFGTIIKVGYFPTQHIISLLISLPVFVFVYSFIVVLPVQLLRQEIKSVAKGVGIARYLYGLLPLLGLLLYGSIVFLLFSK